MGAATFWLSSPALARRAAASLTGARASAAQVLGVTGQRRVQRVETERGPLVLYLSLDRAFVEDLRSAHDFLAVHGIPAPRVLGAATGPFAPLRFGGWALAATHVAGAPFARPATIESASRLGALLGRLHAISEAAPESARLRVRGADDSYWLAFDAARRARLEALLGARAPHARDVLPRVFERLANETRALPATPRHLVHGDIHPENVFVRPDGELCLLDLQSLRFGITELEFNFVLEHYCGRDEALRRSLLDAYRAAIGAEKWTRWEARPAFWQEVGALNLLELQCGILDRARIRGEAAQVRKMEGVVDGTFRQIETGDYATAT